MWGKPLKVRAARAISAPPPRRLDGPCQRRDIGAGGGRRRDDGLEALFHVPEHPFPEPQTRFEPAETAGEIRPAPRADREPAQHDTSTHLNDARLRLRGEENVQ